MSPEHEFQRTLAHAEGGDAVAMYYVAEAYADGIGVGSDARLAVRWYTKAAQRGIVDAMLDLASCYLSGKGVPADREIGRRWLAKAYASDHLITISSQPGAQSRHQLLAMLQQTEKPPSREPVSAD
jgi:TPR repeat protein